MNNSLTKTERHVLELMTLCNGNKQIAKSMGVASRTIGIHITNIYSKLEVNNRVAAILKAVELGYITLPEPVQHVVVHHYCKTCESEICQS